MSLIHSICLLIISAAPLHGSAAHNDYYTSIVALEELLELEHHLLHNLRNYVDQEVAKNQQITLILEDLQSENAKALNHSQEYFGNPINVLKTIKRSVVDLKDLQNYILDGTNEWLYGDKIPMKDTIERLPVANKSDLKGAVLGLERLQETYKLNTSDVADGKFFGIQHGPAMSASDSFYVAVDLYDAEKFERSLEWFTKALEKFNNQTTDEEEFLSKILILEWLCAAAFKADKPAIARAFLSELLEADPSNRYAMQNGERIEAAFFEERNTPKNRIQKGVESVPSTFELYEQTCRGENKLSPTEERPLRCMYVDNGKPFLKIAPFKMEQLSLDPLVVQFHEVIYEKEIQEIINEAKPHLVRSTVGGGFTIPNRISKSAWLDYEEHEFLTPLGLRIEHMTNLSLDIVDDLQVANYGIGGHYAQHTDYSENAEQMFGHLWGNRIATALFYIGNVELGGATAFPLLKLAIKPIRGSLAFWYNMHDSGYPDLRTAHAGCPVLKGSKWIFTQWIHEYGQEFIRPCRHQPPKFVNFTIAELKKRIGFK